MRLDNEATEENESDIEGTDENEIFIDDMCFEGSIQH